MRPDALIDITTELVREVGRLEHPADMVVSSFFRRHRELGPRERHAMAETAYAFLRKRSLYSHLAQSGQGDLDRRLTLLAWQGNDGPIRGGIGPHEQRWLAQVRSLDASAFSDKLRHNLPDWLASALRAQLGEEEFWRFVESVEGGAALDLRVNVLKTRREDARTALARSGIESEPTRWSPWGLRVAGKPALQDSPAFLQGEVEVQDEGSQLLAAIVGARRGEMVVDFCAGAGGKTLALGAAMRSTGRLYAFDVSGHRLDKLKPRLARSGLSNVHPAQLSSERDDRVKRLAGKIDRVLIDAPCSGLGTLRRNPDLKWRVSPASLDELIAKQGAILASASRLVKSGGRLVYATCSPLASEDEDIAQAFGAAHPDFKLLRAAELLDAAQVPHADELDEGGFLRTWPQRQGMDGFFAAAWQRD